MHALLPKKAQRFPFNNLYIKVNDLSLSVWLYRRISQTAEPTWFSFTVSLLVGPGKVYNYFWTADLNIDWKENIHLPLKKPLMAYPLVNNTVPFFLNPEYDNKNLVKGWTNCHLSVNREEFYLSKCTVRDWGILLERYPTWEMMSHCMNNLFTVVWNLECHKFGHLPWKQRFSGQFPS